MFNQFLHYDEVMNFSAHMESSGSEDTLDCGNKEGRNDDHAFWLEETPVQMEAMLPLCPPPNRPMKNPSALQHITYLVSSELWGVHSRRWEGKCWAAQLAAFVISFSGVLNCTISADQIILTDWHLSSYNHVARKNIIPNFCVGISRTGNVEYETFLFALANLWLVTTIPSNQTSLWLHTLYNYRFNLKEAWLHITVHWHLAEQLHAHNWPLKLIISKAKTSTFCMHSHRRMWT